MRKSSISALCIRCGMGKLHRFLRKHGTASHMYISLPVLARAAVFACLPIFLVGLPAESKLYWSDARTVDSRDIIAPAPLPHESPLACAQETRKQERFLLTQSPVVVAFVNEFDRRHQAELSAGYLAGAFEENSHDRWLGDPLTGGAVYYSGPEPVSIPPRTVRDSGASALISYYELKDEVRRIRIALRIYRRAWASLAGAAVASQPISLRKEDLACCALAELVPESAIRDLNGKLEKELNLIAWPESGTSK